MAAELGARAPPRLQTPAAGHLIEPLEFAYPISLILFFLIAFCVHTIGISNRNDSANDIAYGPGGKPLPGKRIKKSSVEVEDFPKAQKLTFQWLSIFVCITFLGNAADVILHVLYARREGYWCGKAAVVSKFRVIHHIARALWLLIARRRFTLWALSSYMHSSPSPSLTKSLRLPLFIWGHGF